jgi:hypothetical protein
MNQLIESIQSAMMRLRQGHTAKFICGALCILAFCSLSLAAEFGTFRLLSLSVSEKLILVSQPPGKAKYLLNAASAKITIDGKPAEYKELKSFSTIQLKMELRKSNKLGIDLDGVATEIRISTGEKAQ